MIRTTRTPRRAAGVLAAALLAGFLAACSGGSDDSAAGTATATATGTSASESTGSEATSASDTEGNADTDADCSGTSCSVTISGDAQTSVLGTQISLGDVQDGRATLSVGDRQVSCSQGESVSAGPLELKCTTVTDDSVTLTASLG
jgi:hypothetical protein